IPREQMIGKTAQEVFPKVHADAIDWHDRVLLETRKLHFVDTHPVDTPGNGVRLLTSTRLPIIGEGGKPQYFVNVLHDVTEHKRPEARLERLEHYDALTDLPNRAVFNACFATTLERAAHDKEQFALLSIDLDRFKEINDVFGHATGDHALRVVSERLGQAV